MTLKVDWFDGRREPRCAPDPRHPKGVDLDMSKGAVAACSTALPYPARRIGFYLIACDVCELRVAVSTAGRPDDPRSVKIACAKPQRTEPQ